MALTRLLVRGLIRAPRHGWTHRGPPAGRGAPDLSRRERESRVAHPNSSLFPSLRSSSVSLKRNTPHTRQFSLGARAVSAASTGPAVANSLQRGFATEGERGVKRGDEHPRLQGRGKRSRELSDPRLLHGPAHSPHQTERDNDPLTT